MSLNDEERRTLVDLYIAKSKELLDDAHANWALKRWNTSANRLYYALMHAINALFVHDGIEHGSHKGMKLIFGKEYVVTGRFSSDDAKLLSQMETMRNRADYDCSFQASAEIIEERYPKVERLISDIISQIE